MRSSLWILPLSILLADIAHADLTVPNFFSDHMVVQRERSAMVWGTADPGATVKVAFKGKTATGKADNDGRWKVAVATGTADSTGADLTVTSGDESIAIQDVLVGEVWFASGQSNMVFPMSRVSAYKDIIAESDYPQIRMFNAPTVTAVEPQEDIAGEWTLCSPESVPKYSATAFFFARKLHKDLDVPIGVIKSAWGGKPVETFTSREALKTLEGTRKLVDAAVAADQSYDAEKAMAGYETRLEKWKAMMDRNKKSRRYSKPSSKETSATKTTAEYRRTAGCAVQFDDQSVCGLYDSGSHLVSGRSQCKSWTRSVRSDPSVDDQRLAKTLER